MRNCDKICRLQVSFPLQESRARSSHPSEKTTSAKRCTFVLTVCEDLHEQRIGVNERTPFGEGRVRPKDAAEHEQKTYHCGSTALNPTSYGRVERNWVWPKIRNCDIEVSVAGFVTPSGNSSSLLS